MAESQVSFSPEDIQKRLAQLEAYLHPSEEELAESRDHYARDPKSHLAGIAQVVSGIFPPRTMRSFFQAGFVRALQTFPYINPQLAVTILQSEVRFFSLQNDPAKKPFLEAYRFAAEKLQERLSP